LFLLVFAIIRGNTEGWGSTLIVSLFVCAVVLLAVFVVAQFRLNNAMFDVSLFRKPTFGGASLVAFTLSAGMFAMFLYLVLYLQTILDFSPLQTGLRFLPFTVISFFVAAASGNLSERVPVRFLLSGGLLLTGIGLMLMRGLTISSHWTALLPGFLVAGAGVGLVNPALASTAIGVVPPQRSGMASGINNTFRQVGIATGIAVLGALFQSELTSKIAPALAGTPAHGHAGAISRAVAAGAAPRVIAAVPGGPARAHAAVAIHSAFTGAMDEILLVAGIVVFAGAALGLVLVRGRDFAGYGAAQPAASAAG
jgi:predicted MFS family arabinose efflux permease